MNTQFVKLHFYETGDILYVNVGRIIAFHRDQGEFEEGTLLFMSIDGDEDGYYIVSESPETIAGLIKLENSKRGELYLYE